jgi:hypothetical protein
MLVNYYWNKTAWMTFEIWNQFLIDLNEQMAQQNRSIILLFDQTSAHCSESSLTSDDLSHVTLHSLPANTTAHLQPMDAGIIRSFKVNNIIIFKLIIF